MPAPIFFKAIVETPRGSTQKFKYDEAAGIYALKKILPAGMFFPYDFGFFPGTKGEDGDPLDVMILSEATGFPGCRIEGRLIGGIKASQVKETGGILVRNDRFFIIPDTAFLFDNVFNMEDLPQRHLKHLQAFFENYNILEGKQFITMGLLSVEESRKLIQEARV